MTVSIDDAREHLGITDSMMDTLIQRCLLGANDACLRYIGGAGEAPDPLPAAFDAAVLMTTAAFFEGREGANLPNDAQALLRDYRPWVFG